jgi:trigger factor
MRTVRGVILPDLNDEFAKTVGSFKNLSALRDVVRANLEQSSKAEYDDDYFVRLLDKLKEGSEIKYPPQIVDREIEGVVKDFEERLASQGWDLEAYLKSKDMDREKFIEEEARPAAIQRLERSLLLDAVTKSEKIELTDKKLNETFQQTWMEFQSSTEYQKSTRGKSPPKRLMDAIAMHSAGRAITQETLDRLKDIATGQLDAEKETKEEKNIKESKPAPPKTEKKEAASPDKKRSGVSKKQKNEPTSKIKK